MLQVMNTNMTKNNEDGSAVQHGMHQAKKERDGRPTNNRVNMTPAFTEPK